MNLLEPEIKVDPIALTWLTDAEVTHLRNKIQYFAQEERCDNINRNYRKRAQNRKWRFQWQQTWLLVDLLLSTGATPKDVINLKVGQFDLANQQIIFQGGPKLRGDRVFVLDANLDFIQHLKQYLEDRGWTSEHDKYQKLFPTWHQNRIVQWHWARALSAANLPHRRITAARNTFARKLFEKTINIEHVKYQLRLSASSKFDHFLLSNEQIKHKVHKLYDAEGTEYLQESEYATIIRRITMMPAYCQQKILNHLNASLK